MKFRINRLIFAGLLAGLFSSCAQNHNSNFYRATGLVDALLTASGARKDVVSVEFQSTSTYPTGQIIGARAVFASPGMHVYGYVRNSFGVSGGRAHVDIILRLGNGELIRAIPVDYFPKPIPPTLRGFSRAVPIQCQLQGSAERTSFDHRSLPRGREVQLPLHQIGGPQDA